MEYKADSIRGLWQQKKNAFESDIQALLNKTKQAAADLREAGQDYNENTRTEQSKLDQLIINLTADLQHIQDAESMKNRLDAWRRSLSQMRDRITDISKSLAQEGLVDPVAISKVCETHDNSEDVYELLKRTLWQCEALRLQHMPQLVKQVCTEIDEWLDRTLQLPIVQTYIGVCNEELLVLLEQKLSQLKDYYNSNKSIIMLYNERVELCKKKQSLQLMAKDRQRYQNRGGALLQEERERKQIDQQLPDIEKQLAEVVQSFQERTRQPFLVRGVDMLSLIKDDRRHHHLAKERQATARKTAARA